MVKFKVNDKVRIKSTLVVDQYYGMVRFNEDMLYDRGKISKISNWFPLSGGYQLEDINYVWSEMMLEPVLEYPRVMLVSNDKNTWEKGVVFMEKCRQYLAWEYAESLEEAEKTVHVTAWKYAKEVEEEEDIVEMTLEEVCRMLGKTIKIVK